MAQKRILVTGSAGNLGQDMMARLGLFNYYEPIGTTSSQLNLAWDKSRIHEVLNLLYPDVIINCAAFTAVDAAETEYDMALKVNRDGPEALAEWAGVNNAYLIHVSTDYVFDGEKGSLYMPDDITNPVNKYGHSKLAGEKAVVNVLPDAAAVVRTSWLFGPGVKNFVPFIINAAQCQTPVRVADDQYGTPTWTGNLAKMLLECIENRPTGILHGCSTGVVNRYDQALHLCHCLGLSDAFMAPVHTDAFNFPAKRPPNTAMQPSFDSALDWQEATARFLMTQGLLQSHV